MEATKMRTELNSTLEELLQLLSSFRKEQFNAHPFEGSWTAGQLAKHVTMFTEGFLQMLNGAVKDTERSPDQLIPKIKADFLNFNFKMKSPDFIDPPLADYDQDDMVERIRNFQEDMDDAIGKLDLTKTCTSFEIPVYGFLTREEAIAFVIYHTQRHVHQLKKIKEEVTKHGLAT